MRELELTGIFSDRIVTELRPAGHFWTAEAYHQNYYRNNPMQSYCVFVVNPKIKKFRDKFAAKRRTS